VDPGFRADNVTTFGVSLPPATRNATGPQVRNSLRELSDKLTATAGIRSASFIIGATPLLSEDDLFFWIEGEPKPAGQSQMHMALNYVVEPGYLDAMESL
jgi:hypothetical protein